MTAPTVDPPADDMTLDQLMDQLSDVSDGHVTAGLKAVQSRAGELRSKASDSGLTADERDEAKSLKDAFAKLDSERATREAAAAEVEEALGSIPEAAEDPEPADEPTEDPDKTDEPEKPQEDEQPESEPASEPTATTAAARPESKTPRLKLGAITKARPQAVAPSDPATPKASLVAAAGDSRRPPGTPLSKTEMHEAIFERAMRLRHDEGSSGDYITVARAEFPQRPDRHLNAYEEVQNSRKIEAVTAPEALTAAGICAPYQIDYSMSAVGSTARPVKAALPNYTVDRGGIQFRRDIDALGSGPVSASGTWTLATDANPGGNTKPIWEVTCNPVISAEVQAITLGLKFSNITNRFDPEAVAANTQAADIAHARYAESILLSSIYSQCTATFQETPARLGATRDLLVAIDKVAAYIRDARRLGQDVPLQCIGLPHWVLNMMRADLARALHTSNEQWLAETDATILQWFSNRGINVSWTLDGRAAQTATGTGNTQTYGMQAQSYGVQSGSQTIPPFPNQVEFALFPQGTFVYLDGGSLDVGVVRDQSLVQTNRYIQFSETWEGVYRKGIEAIRMVVDVQPMGASASTVSPSTFTD